MKLAASTSGTCRSEELPIGVLRRYKDVTELDLANLSLQLGDQPGQHVRKGGKGEKNHLPLLEFPETLTY